jgi:hypothetical protein
VEVREFYGFRITRFGVVREDFMVVAGGSRLGGGSPSIIGGSGCWRVLWFRAYHVWGCRGGLHGHRQW